MIPFDIILRNNDITLKKMSFIKSDELVVFFAFVFLFEDVGFTVESLFKSDEVFNGTLDDGELLHSVYPTLLHVVEVLELVLAPCLVR